MENLPRGPRARSCPGLTFCCTLRRSVCTCSIYIHTYCTPVCSARATGGLSSLGCLPTPALPPTPIPLPSLIPCLCCTCSVWNVLGEVYLETTSLAGWSQARLSLLGCLPVGWWPMEGQIAPRVTAPLAPPHPRLGFYLPPHAPVVGGLPGVSLQLLPTPLPYLCPWLGGILFFIFSFSVSLVRLFLKMLLGRWAGKGAVCPLGSGV